MHILIRRLTVLFVLCNALTPLFAASTPLEQMIDNVKTHQLKNGLKILMLEDHDAPVVAVMFYTRTGSRNEREGITGISHLFEHMMFRGSKKYGPEEHAHLIARHGGDCNASTSNDVTEYHETLPSDQLELAIHLEAERFANLKLDSAVLAEEKKVVSEERRQRTDNSIYGAAGEKFESEFYRTCSYRWPVIGWMKDIEGYTVADVQEYYRLHYAPNNVVGVIVGDFKSDDCIKLVEKYWGKIPSQPTPPQPVMVEETPTAERRVDYKRIAELPMLFAGYPIPPTTHPDIPALTVLSRVLSAGQSSRLNQRLVYKEQMVRNIDGQAEPRMGPGQFSFSFTLKPKVAIADAEKILWEEVERLRNEPITQNELAKAQAQIESGEINRLDRVMSRARMIGRYEISFGDYRKFTERSQALRNVTIADVQRVAKQYLVPESRTVMILTPLPKDKANKEGAEK